MKLSKGKIVTLSVILLLVIALHKEPCQQLSCKKKNITKNSYNAGNHYILRSHLTVLNIFILLHKMLHNKFSHKYLHLYYNILSLYILGKLYTFKHSIYDVLRTIIIRYRFL